MQKPNTYVGTDFIHHQFADGAKSQSLWVINERLHIFSMYIRFDDTATVVARCPDAFLPAPPVNTILNFLGISKDCRSLDESDNM